MPVPERRRTPRIPLERLAYINIEPNNGGIVLNVSEQGLCFHSVASVESGKLRFSLLEQNRRIEGEGELAWMDEMQKVGGLRFTALSAEAREQVQNWITQPATVFDDEESETPPSPAVTRFSSLADRWLKSGANPAITPPRELVAPQHRRLNLLSGFSGGLITGLLVACLVAAGFLFHNYRHQLGESLIQLGVLLSARPVLQVQAHTPNPSGEPGHSMPSMRTEAAPAISAAAPGTQEPLPQMRTRAPESESETRPPGPSVIRMIKVPQDLRLHSSVETPALTPPGLSSTHVVAISNVLPSRDPALPHLETVMSSEAPAKNAETEPPPPMFFEVGKFKQQGRAREVSDQLSQLHFPASIGQKGGLFGSSYYVLVGPYIDPDAAKHAHSSLAASGFKPRAFERGSRSFTLSSGVTLNGTPMAGDYLISWESYIPDAKVKFSQNDWVIATAEGKWVDRGVRTERNAFVYRKQHDGSHILLEIRFEGMSKVLVFSNPS